MIYDIAVVRAENLDLIGRHRAVADEIDKLGRKRARLERKKLEQTPGRLAPPPTADPVDPVYGDVVVVMVREGTGKQVADQIAGMIGE